jgi:hypothetical protein
MRQHQQRRESAGVEGQLTALAGAVAELERRPTTVKTLERRTVIERPSSEQHPPAGDIATTDDDRRHEAAKIIEDRPKVMEARFSRDVPDTAWSGDTEVHLREQFVRLSSPGNEIGSIECRTSLCRMEGSFATKEAFSEMMRGVFGRVDERRVAHGGAMAPLLERTSEGTYHAVIFMAREGTQLLDEPHSLAQGERAGNQR